tara:strand:+ start:1461 stop:2666 length:1206 start_codon:yes stop_codon:yes gene_type:complete
MFIKDFLKLKKLTNIQFAKQLGISEVSLARYIGGERFPEKKILRKIFQITDGLVSADDFFFSSFKNEKLSKEDIKNINNLIRYIKRGSRKHLAKAITLVESTLKKDQMAAENLLEKLKPNDNTIRIGITGVPGVGKSTFIESMGLKLIEKGFKVAVLAIDPSSKRTGGSILGDKTRMERLSVNMNAFIRPTPNDGHLGGVAKKTGETILCLEEFGFNIIFVETMGVGQAETAVYDMVDIFIVLLLPSGGDELQGIKKGIIEIADLIIVNKADNELKKSAEKTRLDYRNALQIIGRSRANEIADVLMCSSLHSIGFEEIWDNVKKFIEKRKINERFYQTRDSQMLKRMWNIISHKTNEYIDKDLSIKPFVRKIIDEIKNNNLSIYRASKIIFQYISKKSIDI